MYAGLKFSTLRRDTEVLFDHKRWWPLSFQTEHAWAQAAAFLLKTGWPDLR
jgi:hypothetical protein